MKLEFLAMKSSGSICGVTQCVVWTDNNPLRPLEMAKLELWSSVGWLSYLPLMTDVFSKFTQAVPTRDQKASTVVEVLVKDCFFRYGVPACLHSNQGRSFEGALVQQQCTLWGAEDRDHPLLSARQWAMSTI